MKMERIDDNEIRCFLTSDDLAARQVSLQDLAYGSEKARKLFQEMMGKATTEMNFKADGIPLMIEAIPLISNGIMLIITKVEDPEELDTRFSRFTQPLKEDSTESVPAAGGRPGLEDLFRTLKNYIESQASERAENIRCFSFDSLSDVIHACRAIYGRYQGHSSLYKGRDGRFYMLLTRREGDLCSPENLHDAANIMNEYGTQTLAGDGTPDYFEEHYAKLVKSKAVDRLGKTGCAN